jgi:hypothetical protein
MEEIVRAELLRQKDDARSTIYRGLALIGLVPLVIAAAIIAAFALMSSVYALLVLLVGAAYTLIGGVAGIATMIAGGFEYRRIGKQLHDYDHVRQLPEARLVVRPAATGESSSR